MTTFFKLDTGQLQNFDAALGPDCTTFRTGGVAVLRALAARRGWGAALATLMRSALIPDAGQRKLVQGNLERKRIRLPQVFGNPIVMAIYGWVKATQAGLLKAALDAEFSATDPQITIVYNGSLYPEAVLATASEGRRRVFVEAGFFPRTLQIDPVGLNGANSVPRDPAFYLKTKDDFSAKGLPQAVNNRASKAAGADSVDLAPGYIFVPFQVPSDMQVTVHSPWVRDMEMFLDVVREAADRNPDEIFVIKEHPSFKRSVKTLRPPHKRVIFANGNVTSELIENARAVLTLNSTVGIEALLFDKPVITLGNACYNIEGLVFHAEDAGALDAAIAQTRGWTHDEKLRRQFVGYLWNEYLLQGKYDDLPKDLGNQLTSRST